MISGVCAFLALLILLLADVPVAISLAAVGIAGSWILDGPERTVAIFSNLPYQSVAEYAFVIIPMFLLMGTLAAETKLTTDLYNACYKLLSRVKGSLYIVTTIASGLFAAVSGSTIVNAVVFTKIALPEMLRLKYSKRFSLGCIAGAGTFAALIPPSIAMVVFAILTDESVGRLLIAGLLPGLITIVVYILGISLMVRLDPSLAPNLGVKFHRREKAAAVLKAMPIVVVMVIVLGGIYTGMVMPSSAGSIGAVGVFAIAVLYRRMTRARFKSAIIDAAATTGVLFFILIGGFIFSRMLLLSGFIGEVTGILIDLQLSKMGFILLVAVIYIILGALMDSTSMMVATIPVLFPIGQSLGIDTLWFAVIVVKLIELGCITPPVGLNLFAVMSSSSGVANSTDIIRGVLPFIVMELFALGVIILFPAISTVLPDLMMNW